MNNLKKAFAAIVAAGCLLGVVGCGDKDKHADIIIDDDYGNIAEEDLPYGSTITQLKSSNNENVKLSIEYDNRFLTEEEAIKVSDYMAALNSVDGELMENTVYPDYLQYLMEANNYTSSTDYLKSMHDSIKDTYLNGSDFDFNFVLINAFYDENDSDDDTGFLVLDTLLDSYASSLDKDAVTPKITSRKMVKIDTMYTLADDDGSYLLSNRTDSEQGMYIYTIDGQIYIL